MKEFCRKICCCCCKKNDSVPLIEDYTIELEQTTIRKINKLTEDDLFEEKNYNQNEKEKGIKWVK